MVAKGYDRWLELGKVKWANKSSKGMMMYYF